MKRYHINIKPTAENDLETRYMQIAEDDLGTAGANLSPEHPYYHGVFELELGALDIITEAVKRRNDEREGVDDLAGELAKLKIG